MSIYCVAHDWGEGFITHEEKEKGSRLKLIMITKDKLTIMDIKIFEVISIKFKILS